MRAALTLPRPRAREAPRASPGKPVAPTSRAIWLTATALGVAAFALVRAVGTPLPRPLVATAVVANVLAAVIEEAFFRRFLYGVLSRWGAAVAIAGSAFAFAIVHVPEYGVAVLPLDLAAGLLLSWQRHVTGGWTAPAVTHAVANLLQMG